MTYNDFLANRVRKAFANKNAAYTETVSFGPVEFSGERLLLRRCER